MTAGPRAELVVGLDVGTTAAKAVAFDLGARRRSVGVREHALVRPVPGQEVQDPDAVVAGAVAALADCLRERIDSDVLGISLSAAMHGLIGLDECHRPLTPLITWADSRAEHEARLLHVGRRADDLHRRTGTPVHPMSPLVKLLWFARHAPDLCARVRWWVGLKDFFLLRLTGVLATELSSASGTGLLDLATRDWDPEILALAGVDREQLPPVLPTTATLGLAPGIASVVGLPPGTPVVAGAADGPLGNLGSNALAPGTVAVSVGTSAAARIVVPRPAPDPDGGLFSYALTDDRWVVGGAVSNGADAVRWAGIAVRADGGPTADDALLALAGEVPAGSDGLVMLPYLLPERAPLWRPDLAGGYLGLRRDHSPAHLLRAAVEGVCLQIGTVVDRLAAIEPVRVVHATGGALRAPLWRTTLAAALDRPVLVRDAAEGTARGAAVLGLVALGRARDLADGLRLLEDPVDADGVVVPDPDQVRVYADLRRRVPVLLDALASAVPAGWSATAGRS